MIIAKGLKDPTNGLNKLDSNNAKIHVCTIEEDTSVNIWHCRLGHVNFRMLHDMTSNVEGMPYLQMVE